MKKVLSIISAVILLCLSVVPCYAAETTMTEPGSEDIGVYVNASYTPAFGTIGAPIDDGKYTVETSDGTVITVKPETAVEGLTLVVYPVPTTDKEAYEWFENSAKYFGNMRYYYDIYFVDAAGNRVDGGECEVMLTLSEAYGTPKTAILGKDGIITEIANSAEAGKVKFTMSESGYYVLAEAIVQPDAPKTGDTGNMVLWLVLMLVRRFGIVATEV